MFRKRKISILVVLALLLALLFMFSGCDFSADTPAGSENEPAEAGESGGDYSDFKEYTDISVYIACPGIIELKLPVISLSLTPENIQYGKAGNGHGDNICNKYDNPP